MICLKISLFVFYEHYAHVWLYESFISVSLSHVTEKNNTGLRKIDLYMKYFYSVKQMVLLKLNKNK